MNKNLYSSMALLAMLATPAVHAAEDKLYAGVAVGTSGVLTVSSGAGRFDSTNKPASFDLYGGYDFNDNFAIEAGYARFGKFKFDSPATVDLSAMHVAAKGSMALGDSFSVYAKLGLARDRVEVAGLAPGSETTTKTRALIGIGADYRLTGKLAVSLGYTDYGTIKDGDGKLNIRRVEAGLKYHF